MEEGKIIEKENIELKSQKPGDHQIEVAKHSAYISIPEPNASEYSTGRSGSPSISSDSQASEELAKLVLSTPKPEVQKQNIEKFCAVFIPPCPDFFQDPADFAKYKEGKLNPVTLDFRRTDLKYIQSTLAEAEEKREKLHRQYSQFREKQKSGHNEASLNSPEKDIEKTTSDTTPDEIQLGFVQKLASDEAVTKKLLELAAIRDDLNNSLFTRYKAATNIMEVGCQMLNILVKRLMKKYQVKQKAKNWIEVVLEMISLAIKSNETKDPAGFKTNTVYFVMTTEYAINGHRRINESKKILETKYNAQKPIPSKVEKYMCKKLHRKLIQQFGEFKIVFALSCCTYQIYKHEPIVKDGMKVPKYIAMVPQYTNDDGTIKQIGTNVRKLASTNRITVLTSTTREEKKITKCFIAQVDENPSYLSEPNVDTYFPPQKEVYKTSSMADLKLKGSEERKKELKFDFGCFGEPSKEVAFATCLDVLGDEIPTDVNLGVFLASGFPFGKIKDFEFPFIVNDSEYWRVKSKYPGLFFYSDSANSHMSWLYWKKYDNTGRYLYSIESEEIITSISKQKFLYTGPYKFPEKNTTYIQVV